MIEPTCPKYSTKHCAEILTDIYETGAIFYWATTVAIPLRRTDGNIKFWGIAIDETKTFHNLTPRIVNLGIKRLFAPGFQIDPSILQSIRDDDIDAEAGDCIIQAALFRDVVYG